MAELESGRSDPGRPLYDEVSGEYCELVISTYLMSCLTNALGVWWHAHNTTPISL